MRRYVLGHIADSHYDEASRLDECVRVHAWIAEDMRERHVDLVGHSGDLWHKRSTIRDRMAAAQSVQEWADIAPVVIVRGNHDVDGDLTILGRLQAKHPIVVEEGCSAHIVRDREWAAVGALAWPRKAWLLAQLGQTVTPAQSSEMAQHHLRNMLIDLGNKMDVLQGSERMPRIVLAHAMVRGAVASTGQPLVGHDMELSIEELALARAHYFGLGHIHKGQDWSYGIDGVQVPFVFPGSPRRTDFGELEEKAYVVATFEQPEFGSNEWHCAGFERVAVPATRMLHVAAEWMRGGAFVFDLTKACGPLPSRDDAPALDAYHRWETFPKGAEVRFRYLVDADCREAARARADEWAALLRDCGGAVDVTVEEEIRPVNHARAPEIVSAPSLAAKFDLWTGTRGMEISPERRERLHAKLALLKDAEP